MIQKRLRDLGILIGSLPTGPFNAITDVPGVLVGQTTVIRDQPLTVRSGVTAIFPRGNVHEDFVFAGYHSFNGIGEMTGLPFLQDTGLLTTPLLLTNTNQVGMVYDAVVRYGAEKHGGFSFKLPVVAETYDGWLNDVDSFPLTRHDVVAALESAQGGAVPEGNSGGGTGMICYEFKGGTGTSSRRVRIFDEDYLVGALVQANHGDRADLRIDGVPVGREIGAEQAPMPWPQAPATSSILIIIATNAPLLPDQCRRLAQRGTVGLARTGGLGLDGSGDLFLAFSTGNHFVPAEEGVKTLRMLPPLRMDALVKATVEAVEEAIGNVLVAAETMTGFKDHTAYALPHDALRAVMARYRPA